MTGFLGPNGAGKTTTMQLILGLDYPSAGTVAVNDKPYAQLPDPMHEVGALLDAGAAAPPATTCSAWPRPTASAGACGVPEPDRRS